jgi:hypothetical protein
VTSFAAHHRKVVRQARRDQIRHEIREGIELLERCAAGDPEALRQTEENRRMLAEAAEVQDDYPEVVEPVPCRPPRRGFFAALRRRFFATAVDQYDDSEPEPEPDEGPRHAQRPGESDRAFRRRLGRPDLAERRAAALLARGYWDANRPLPGAIREALCALSMAPRELRRLLVTVWDRLDWSPREVAPVWVPTPRELARTAGRPRKAAHWLEVCLHTGPPAAGTAAVGTLPDCTGGAVIGP